MVKKKVKSSETRFQPKHTFPYLYSRQNMCMQKPLFIYLFIYMPSGK